MTAYLLLAGGRCLLDRGSDHVLRGPERAVVVRVVADQERSLGHAPARPLTHFTRPPLSRWPLQVFNQMFLYPLLFAISDPGAGAEFTSCS